MNTLPSEIITNIFIPKYLEQKYHNYSLDFKIDIYYMSQKYKKVVNEFNKHINIFYDEDMFKLMPNRLNYFDKLHKIQYKAHGFKYKLNYPKYLIRDKKIFYIDRDRDGIINNFLIKNKELTNLWKSLVYNYTEYSYSDDEDYLNDNY